MIMRSNLSGFRLAGADMSQNSLHHMAHSKWTGGRPTPNGGDDSLFLAPVDVLDVEVQGAGDGEALAAFLALELPTCNGSARGGGCFRHGCEKLEVEGTIATVSVVFLE